MTQLAAPPMTTHTPTADVGDGAELTAADLRRLEDDALLEYVDGHFVEKNVSRRSSGVAFETGHLLRLAAGDPPEVEVFVADLTYHCHPARPKWYRRPDVSVIRKERLEELGDVGMMPIPADLVVEVISPNDLAHKVLEKVAEYLDAGFPLIWLVDPELRSIHVYRGDGTITRLREHDEIDGGDALPRFRRRVGELMG